ncbi:MAG: hypothetical protein QXZ08_03160, partial [Nitrososphaeria archaeon]
TAKALSVGTAPAANKMYQGKSNGKAHEVVKAMRELTTPITVLVAAVGYRLSTLSHLNTRGVESSGAVKLF